MSTLVTIVHVICCLFLMLTVLLQSGKGGGMGAAFGGGTSATVFGGSGASTFLKKLTAGAATVFMLTSMTLAYFSSTDAGDSLEDFGNEQNQLFKQKEAAKQQALDEAAKDNAETPGTGSAGSTDMLAPPPGMDDGEIQDPPTGSAGSASTTTPAEVPAEIPAPGAGSAAAPTPKPAAPKPATPAATPAPKPATRPASTPPPTGTVTP